jgi:hypothetical protein
MPYVPSSELHCNYILIMIIALFIGINMGQSTLKDPCKRGYSLSEVKTLDANPALYSLLNAPQPPFGVDYKGPDVFSLVCTRD